MIREENVITACQMKLSGDVVMTVSLVYVPRIDAQPEKFPELLDILTIDNKEITNCQEGMRKIKKESKTKLRARL